MNTESSMLLVLDLLGTFAFGLNGALTAVRATRLDIVGVITLGMITALGGGTLRDALVGEIPAVMRTGLYAVPALIGATVVVVASGFGVHGPQSAIAAAVVCFLIRMLGLRFDLDAPEPPGRVERSRSRETD